MAIFVSSNEYIPRIAVKCPQTNGLWIQLSGSFLKTVTNYCAQTPLVTLDSQFAGLSLRRTEIIHPY